MGREDLIGKNLQAVIRHSEFWQAVSAQTLAVAQERGVLGARNTGAVWELRVRDNVPRSPQPLARSPQPP
jgi:hypothetical protein